MARHFFSDFSRIFVNLIGDLKKKIYNYHVLFLFYIIILLYIILLYFIFFHIYHIKFYLKICNYNS